MPIVKEEDSVTKLKKLIAPTDLSKLSSAGVRYALEIGLEQGCEIIVYHVIDVGEDWFGEDDRLLCGCQAHYIRDLFFLSSFMTTVLPDQRETCCYAWHGTRSSHLLGMRPSLRHKAPGSLSQASNRQEFFSPGSACRRVVPWGDVSSWVKGAE